LFPHSLEELGSLFPAERRIQMEELDILKTLRLLVEAKQKVSVACAAVYGHERVTDEISEALRPIEYAIIAVTELLVLAKKGE
jgi:hypothetical protein